jgi:hypothetical protein
MKIMIKFFRRIRQKLLSENNFSRYLLYAVGEIVLVVIGILIALQINNWNQERLETIEERKILKNLAIDFANNKLLLDSVFRETQGGIESGLNILDYTGNKDWPETSRTFDSILNAVFISPAYLPVIGTLDEITNSGRLGIIKNTELRKLLSTWPAVVERVKGIYEVTRYNERLLNDFVLLNGNWLNADQVIIKKNRSITFPISGFESDNRTMLNSNHFENLIENVTINLDNYLIELIETKELLNRIETLINSEINYN